MAYNGWKNYETWCVSLWIDNDSSLYATVDDLVRDQDSIYRAGEAIQQFVDDLAEETCPGCRSGASFVADLIGAALSEVDWTEIAANRMLELSDS